MALRVSALLALLALVGVSLAALPSIVEVERCAAVGLSSGCSGCNDATSDCQWCVSPLRTSAGVCLPTNACDTYYDIAVGGEQVPYVVGKKQCEALNYPTKSEPQFAGVQEKVANSVVFNAAFDSHFCNFPSEPWVIDRTATPAGFSAPESCYLVNNKNAIGQRLALERCVAEDLNLPIVHFTIRDEECIRYYNSLLCTSMCPQYGVGTDFQKLCYNYCARLEQVCSASLLACLEDQTRLPISCEAKGEQDCDAPDLIPTSGRLEYELCYYGDKSRCGEKDCILVPSTVIDNDFAGGDATAPCCRGYQSGCNGHSQCNSVSLPQESSVGFAFDIFQRNKPGGRSCEDVAQQKTINALEGTAFVPLVYCAEDLPGVPQKCFTSATKRTSGFPSYCDSITDAQSCPTFFFENCAQVSEGQVLRLTCPSGFVISEITFANYGRPTGSCGSYAAGAGCSPGIDWRTQIANACVGDNSCTFTVNNGVSGDPCGGVFKWAAVQYRCAADLPLPEK